MRRLGILLVAVVLAIGAAQPAQAFCGFYVAKADSKLYNRASKVIVARSGDRTVITMASDYEGDPKEFALIIPAPVVLKREQVNVTETALVDHVDAYTAPRLVEYFDEDPCQMRRLREMSMAMDAAMPMAKGAGAGRAESLGVTIEESYSVGEYDILVLSAKESDGLATWLRENGYKVPKAAEPVLQSYILQDTKFFVAKVNLKEQAKRGGAFLRPIQIAFESPKFMLPVRLGTVNSDGPQEMFAFFLTQRGRVETVNYRTVKIPTDNEIPLYVKQEFGPFYKAMFDTAHAKEPKATFLEYAWNMNWCDPCAADPIPNEKLIELGAFWLIPGQNGGAPAQPQWGGGAQVFITRMHIRYSAKTFPEDLVFQETTDNSNFQGRYILRHSAKEIGSCPEAATYRTQLAERHKTNAETLARLTNWPIEDIRKKMRDSGENVPTPIPTVKPVPWYQEMWKNR